MYIKKNLSKPSGISPGAAAPKDPNVVIIDAEDILSWPQRDSKGVKFVGNFVFKAGAKMHTFYSTSSKISAPFESDGEEDAISISPKFEAQHPGNSLEVKEFVQNWIGKNVIILHGSCQDSFREVVGTKCAPLQLKPAKQDNTEGRFHSLVFESFNPSGTLPGHYEGALIFDAPKVVGLTGIEISEENGPQYKVVNDTVDTEVEIDSVDYEHGGIVTFIGGGETTPGVITTGVNGTVSVLLKDGVDWVAVEGSIIHFQVFNGAATTTLIELSRE